MGLIPVSSLLMTPDPRSLALGAAPTDDAIARYLAGDCTVGEIAQVEEWLARNPHHAMTIEALSTRLRDPWVGATTAGMDSVESRFNARLANETMSKHSSLAQRTSNGHGLRSRSIAETHQRLHSGIAPRNRIAAWVAPWVAVIVIGIWGITQSIQSHSGPSEQAVHYATAKAQRAVITLGDGTRVKLGPATELSVIGRRVVLNGEAIFRVVPSKKQEFVVESHGVMTRVLGTEFGVRGYDSTVTVAVRSGRVAINGVVAQQRDIAIVTSGSVDLRHGQRIDDALALEHDGLVFTGTPLGEAISDLNRWYDADVRLADAGLAARKLLARVSGGSPKELAELLKIVLDVDVELNGRVITLSER